MHELHENEGTILDCRLSFAVHAKSESGNKSDIYVIQSHLSEALQNHTFQLRHEMKPIHLMTCFLLLSSLMVTLNSASADTIYNVVPYQLSDGYEIVGGTITTDDTVGDAQVDFFRANIIDYEIIVTGPINLTFSPNNFAADIFSLDAGVVVTPTEIYVEAQAVGDFAELRFRAREFLPINTVRTIQDVRWGQGGSPTQRSSVGFIDSGGPTNQGNLNFTPMLDRLVVATVPEPAAGVFHCAMLVFAVCARRKREL